jgi:hypothetical protein
MWAYKGRGDPPPAWKGDCGPTKKDDRLQGGYVDRATYCTHLADIYGAAHLGVADYPRPTCAQVRRRLSEATA